MVGLEGLVLRLSLKSYLLNLFHDLSSWLRLQDRTESSWKTDPTVPIVVPLGWVRTSMRKVQVLTSRHKPGLNPILRTEAPLITMRPVLGGTTGFVNTERLLQASCLPSPIQSYHSIYRRSQPARDHPSSRSLYVD